MKILITGIAGLLGSRLADWILENTDNEVIGVDDLSGGYIENINSKVKFYKFDLVDLNEVEGLFKNEKPDIVYHFAAYAAEGLSPFIRKYNYENNLIASANLITKSIQYDVKRFVFASSMSVYGDKYIPPFSEELQQFPIDSYGIAKFSVEQDLKVAYEQHGLKYTIIRPHNFYGVNQNIWDKYRNVLGIWMYQHMNKESMTIFGDGEQKRAFSYIDDCLEPLWNAGVSEKASKEIINLGGIKEYSINEACEILQKVVGGSETLRLEKRHEVKNAYPTYQKSIDILNYKETISLEEGLKSMWIWAQEQPKRKRIEWEEYELEKGIYSFWKKNG